jgi:hypothetical protein
VTPIRLSDRRPPTEGVLASLQTWLTGSSADPEANVTAVLGCSYLLLVNLTGTLTLNPQSLPLTVVGDCRAILLLLLIALLPVGQYLGPRLDRANRWMFVVLAVLSALESARTIATPHHTHAILSAIIAFVPLTFVVDLPDRPLGLTGQRARWLCVAAILAVCLASGALKPKEYDIAGNSVSAIKAILMAHNPYTVDLDRGGTWNTGECEGLWEQHTSQHAQCAMPARERFFGYKYGPLLPLTYLPFVQMLGTSGVLIGNIVALLLTSLGISAVCRHILDYKGVWATILFLASPLVGMYVLVFQANDLLAILPICGAFLVWDRYPALAGLLLGASVSVKIFPSPVAMALLLPSDLPKAGRFVAGITGGLIPVMLFVAIDPAAFFNNVVLFQIMSPILPSSWVWQLPSTVVLLLRMGLVASFLVTVATAVIREWPIERRMRAYVVLIIGLLLISPHSHFYYWLWWIPFYLPMLCMGRISKHKEAR